MTITTAVPIIKVAPYAPITLLAGTSSSSVTIGTGPLVFAVNEVNIGIQVGMRMRATSSSLPANWVEGTVTAISSAPAATITINADLFAGTGTFTAWNVTMAGQPGQTGATGAKGDKGDPGSPASPIQTVSAPLAINGTILQLDIDATLAVSGNNLGLALNAVLPGAPTTTTPVTTDSSTKVATTAFTQAAITASAAPLASPAFTGNPTAPTPATSPANNSTSIATTAYVQSVLTAAYQPLDADLTALAALSATGAFFYRSAANTWAPVTMGANISFSGGVLSAVGGTGAGIPEAPTDGKLYARASVAWTATPIQADAAADGNYYARRNNTWGSIGTPAPLNSPAFTGTPTAPTPVSTDNSTTIPTTAYVKAQLASPVFTGNPTAPTQAPNDNSMRLATTAYVQSQGYALLASPVFSGTPSAPTAPLATNTNQVATCAFVQQNTGAAPPTIQVFLSGSGTYTRPVSCRWIRVRMAGGGGGGSGGNGGAGGAPGGNTTFGSLAAAGGAGSAGAPGTGVGGDINLQGGSGSQGSASTSDWYGAGGPGGNSVFGGAGGSIINAAGYAASPNTGSGGGGGGTINALAFTGVGGSAGGYCEKIIGSPAATYPYAVGPGGGGGVGAAPYGYPGGNGAPGIIIVEEHY